MEENYFYERRVPEVGELVMARVEEISESGVICRLLEYNNLEALLQLSEISRKRLRSIRKVINVGNVKVFQVLRQEKGYVDLTKKQVDAEMIEEGTEKYEKGKHAMSIVRQLAEVTHQPYEDLCKELLWPLYETERHPYHLFKELTFEGKDHGIKISREVEEALKKIIRQRIVTKEEKVGARVELTCYTYEGIDTIRAAVKRVLEGRPQIKIYYIKAPEYEVSTVGIDHDKCALSLEETIHELTETIRKMGGECKILSAPKAIREEEEEDD